MRYLAYGMSIMMLASMAIGFLAAIMLPAAGASGDTDGIIGMAVMGLGYFGILVFAVMFGKRRLNDLNRSGWWFWVALVVIWLAWACMVAAAIDAYGRYA